MNRLTPSPSRLPSRWGCWLRWPSAALVIGIATLTLGLIVSLAAVPMVSPFGPPHANAAPISSGTFTPDPSTGSDVTVVNGVTNGTCDVPGTEEAPVDGYNAVVLGPGVFVANPDVGRADGLAVVGTTDVGFSTTDPIPFTLRGKFRGFAQELDGALLPGDYVITFRCVNQFTGVVYQTFSATLTFTGGPPATTYVVTNPPPTTSPSSGPPPSSTVAGSGGTGTGSGDTLANGAPVATMVTVGLALGVIVLLGVLLLLAVRRRRAS